MSKLFIQSKEINFINNINKELIQKIIGQEVIYYAISDSYTKSHRLYDEATQKVFQKPVITNALVEWNGQIVSSMNFSVDVVHNAVFYFHKKELDERNLIIRVGDFIEFSNIFFELMDVTTPQLIFGQANQKIMMQANGIQSRLTNFSFDTHGSISERSNVAINSTKTTNNPGTDND